MDTDKLATTAQAMVPIGKGILAADEDPDTLQNRFATIALEATPENSRTYREMLFSTPGLEEFISGIILFDETLRQTTRDGVPFAEFLAGRGIIAGIKADLFPVDLPGFAGEVVSEGLDGLAPRLAEAQQLGARFAKWRAVITVGEGIPTPTCIEANAHALARYAACSQAVGLVPIVEPEVLMDGVHSIAACEQYMALTLAHIFMQLHEHRVALNGIVMKPSMVLAGKDCPQQASVNEVAAATVRCFMQHIPASVPGIAFLSGGQTPLQATQHLNAISKIGPHPWNMSFCYGRALQAPVLAAWQGKRLNEAAAQQAFYHRAQCNSAACLGQYSAQLERTD